MGFQPKVVSIVKSIECELGDSEPHRLLVTFLLKMCGVKDVDGMNYQAGLKDDHFSLIPLLCAFRI